MKKKIKFFFNFSYSYLSYQFLIFLIFLQIIIGAFVSGLDAGKIYQTWPFMGNTFFPNDLEVAQIDDLVNFENHSLVQFYHRNLAYVIFFYVIFLSIRIYKHKIKKLYLPLKILLISISLQIILGVVTLVSNLNIFLASAHQITGVC